MSPLVRFIGGASPSDATEFIRLNPDEETGQERLLRRGDPEYLDVSAEELKQIASHYEVEIKSDDQDNEPASPSQRPGPAPSGGDRPSVFPTGGGTSPSSPPQSAGSSSSTE